MTAIEPQGGTQSGRQVVAASFIGTIEPSGFFLYGPAAAFVFRGSFFGAKLDR
jgi:hypothetical protein